MRYDGFIICLVFIITAYFSTCTGESYKQFIAVNLAGYQSDDIKQAFLVNSEATSFKLIHLKSDETVYEDVIGPVTQPDSASGDKVSVIDFSAFTGMGEYLVRVELQENPGVEIESDPFMISRDLYAEVTNTVLQSFYFHRCGTQVKNSSEWEYDYCHLDDAPLFDQPGRSKDVSGGWHDAGDYNKFSVNTAFSIGMLLYLFDSNPGYFEHVSLDIPEKGGGTPDLLDEIRWGLDWMLRMQDRGGGIYHKVSQKKWYGEFLPDEDTSERYLFKVSSTATAQFAAVAALGARVIYPYDPNYATRLRRAAQRSWRYLEKNPVIQPIGGFVNPPDVYGGEYGDKSDMDERLWASAELYRLTHEKRFISFIENNTDSILEKKLEPASWRNVHALALFALMDIPDAEIEGPLSLKVEKLTKRVFAYLTGQTELILKTLEKNNYRHLNHHTEFYWGSNSVGLAYAYQMIKMFELTGNLVYREAAQDQLHYVLGRNPVGMSQVTGVGSVAVTHPYHQLSEIGKFSKPVPGMLVGGANNYIFLNNKPISSYPAKNYEDSFSNYYVNEPAINFTAALAFVSAQFIDVHNIHPVMKNNLEYEHDN